ncbi:MAG: hypothetical protein LBK59_08230 [Bifidobacteriaceae bacterium]|jgi:plasmid stabilization system protein ParE|nr:hypothetical protein [Bifidobacteriaceae bacterium]
MTAVIVRTRAHQDVEEALGWYLAVAPNLASQLVDEFDALRKRLARFPQIFAEVHRNVRLAPDSHH